MFRDSSVSCLNFTLKFKKLKEKLDEQLEVQLDSEYHRQLKEYIERVYQQTCFDDSFDDESFDNIRDAEMSNLNRLQKLKNGISYKKDKHKSQRQNEDWG